MSPAPDWIAWLLAAMSTLAILGLWPADRLVDGLAMSKTSKATPFGPKAKTGPQGSPKTGPTQKGGRVEFKGYEDQGLPHPLHDPDSPKGSGSPLSPLGGMDALNHRPKNSRPSTPSRPLEGKELRFP